MTASPDVPEKKRLHFKNPPIVEAVLAFTIPPQAEGVINEFHGCRGEMADLGYPKLDPLSEHALQIRIESGLSAAQSTDSPSGIRFTSKDGLHVAQFNRKSFVFSRVGHYDRWEQFRDEGKKIWQVYRRVTTEAPIIMVAVRFINKLLIPRNSEPEEFIHAFPSLPQTVAPTFNEVFMRVVCPIPDPPGRFIHNQALLPPEKDGFSTVLFDNDFQFPVEGKPESEIWEMLETIRDIKDYYFLELTTERMRDTFDA